MTRIIDSLHHLNKELPAAEGGRHRQVRAEDYGAVSRTSNLPCPKTRGAQYQHPTPKSGFLSVGYPVLQNICHTRLGLNLVSQGKFAQLFNIIRSSGFPTSLRSWRDLPAAFIAYRCACNSLIYLLNSVSNSEPHSGARCSFNPLMDRSFSAYSFGQSLFSWRGLPTSVFSLFI